MAIRVNVGGKKYTDSKKRLWQGDKAYYPGGWGCANLPATDIMFTSDAISGTKDPTIFQTMRVGEEVIYKFDIPNGKYRINLLFAEIYWETNDAEMEDIYIQGRKALGNFNIFDEAGHDEALEKSYVVDVKKGRIELRFVGISLPMHAGARVCGIEINKKHGK